MLLEALPERIECPEETAEAAARIDKHYLPTRYPDSIPASYPGRIQRVVLFGSLARGRATPRSDADLLGGRR